MVQAKGLTANMSIIAAHLHIEDALPVHVGDDGPFAAAAAAAAVAYMHRQSIFNMEVGGDDGHVGGQPFCLDHI